MESKTLDEKLVDIINDRAKGKFIVYFLNNDNIDWKKYDLIKFTTGIARQSNSQIGASAGSLLESREYTITIPLVTTYSKRKTTKDDIEYVLGSLNQAQFSVNDRVIICNYNGCMTSQRQTINGEDYELIDFNFSFTITDNLSIANNTKITIDNVEMLGIFNVELETLNETDTETTDINNISREHYNDTRIAIVVQYNPIIDNALHRRLQVNVRTSPKLLYQINYKDDSDEFSDKYMLVDLKVSSQRGYWRNCQATFKPSK